MDLNKDLLISLGFEADKDRFKQEIFRLEWLPFSLQYIDNDCHLDDTPIEPYYGLRFGNALFSHPLLRDLTQLKELCKMFAAVLKSQ